jgi:hypothetical protein
VQYKNKPKAGAVIHALLSELVIYELIEELKSFFSLEKAEGIPLDVLSGYLGGSRLITGRSFRHLFNFINYSEFFNQYEGFWSYDNYGETSKISMFYYDKDNETLYSLTDEELRLTDRFCNFLCTSNQSLKDINDFLGDFFPMITVSDNLNSTITYNVPENMFYILDVINKNGKLPHCAGVRVMFNVV